MTFQTPTAHSPLTVPLYLKCLDITFKFLTVKHTELELHPWDRASGKCEKEENATCIAHCKGALPNYTNTENLKIHLFTSVTKIYFLLIYFQVNRAVLLIVQSCHPNNNKQLCFFIGNIFQNQKAEVFRKLANAMLV